MHPNILLPLLLTPLTVLAKPTHNDISCTTWFSTDCDASVSQPGDSQTVAPGTYNANIATDNPFLSIKCSRDLRDKESLDVSILPLGFDVHSGKNGDGRFPDKTGDLLGAKCAKYQMTMPKKLGVCQAVSGTCWNLKSK